MSDEYVLKSQKYLNSMYGGHPSWVTLQENGNTGTDAASIRIYLFSYTIKKSAANRSHSLRRIWGMSNSVGRISLTSPETGFIMTTSEKDLLNFLYRLYQADIPERFRSIKFLIYY